MASRFSVSCVQQRNRQYGLIICWIFYTTVNNARLFSGCSKCSSSSRRRRWWWTVSVLSCIKMILSLTVNFFNSEHHVGSVKVPIHTIHKHHYKKVPEYKIVKVPVIKEVKVPYPVKIPIKIPYPVVVKQEIHAVPVHKFPVHSSEHVHHESHGHGGGGHGGDGGAGGHHEEHIEVQHHEGGGEGKY